MHGLDENNAALDYYFDDIYDEASFRLDLKHANAERRAAALAAEYALRRLAQLRAPNENSSVEETFGDVFDKKRLERDLHSSDDLLAAAARAAVHHLVHLFDLRIDEWFERQPKLPPRVPTPEDVERERLRAVIQDRADWGRTRPRMMPHRSGAALKLV